MTSPLHVSVVIPNFNGAATVLRCVQALATQRLPETLRMSIVVVDDASTDDSLQQLRALGDRIVLVAQPTNQGRCVARNAGAAAIASDAVLFIDSDCVPTGDDFVARHAENLRAGAGLGFGDICTPGEGFWDRLQADASRSRLARFRAGQFWAFTTSNVCMGRQAFDRSGGFDTAFERYGFEDVDLFVRLHEAGVTARYCEHAAVRHEDVLTLASVCRKISEAGRHGAPIFSARHPAVYRQMAFSRFDAQRRPWLRGVDFVGWPLVGWLANRSDAWLEWRWLPLRLRMLAARACYALAYLHGTVLQSRGGKD